ncbi:hypothetical protein HMN09_00482900 [Mycena chlorophos]|uniref:Uncharacterized protein n=1 Tax=Mycena chlorophos TaxID=658473 RepID=A0A8H6TIS4_MYCCL|nr:hypothetical protein HMN09_00482900 [Mycena chlorophos]
MRYHKCPTPKAQAHLTLDIRRCREKKAKIPLDQSSAFSTVRRTRRLSCRSTKAASPWSSWMPTTPPPPLGLGLLPCFLEDPETQLIHTPVPKACCDASSGEDLAAVDETQTWGEGERRAGGYDSGIRAAGENLRAGEEKRKTKGWCTAGRRSALAPHPFCDTTRAHGYTRTVAPAWTSRPSASSPTTLSYATSREEEAFGDRVAWAFGSPQRWKLVEAACSDGRASGGTGLRDVGQGEEGRRGEWL